MTAISQKLPNLIGGVSQQPDTIKYSNQLRTCTNYYPDITFGLGKRPGVQGVKKLDGAVADGTWFTLFRDKAEKYIVQFSKAGAIKIWNVRTGAQQTVNAVAASATTYATHVDTDDLALFQINDYAFVVNRKVKVLEKTADISAAITPYAFVAINTVSYSSRYTVRLDGTAFSYDTTTTATNQLNVRDITSGLVTLINANPAYVCDDIGNVIYIRRANNADFTIQAYGGTGGTAIEAFKDTVRLAANLPKQFVNGLKIKVEADIESKADDYWVEFKTTQGTSNGVGKWIETLAPGTVRSIDDTTMPHAIIREADGTFTFRKLGFTEATGQVPTAPNNGVVTAATVTGTPKGRYVVGQTFSVTGGTGTGLVLKVSAVKTVTTTNTYPYPNASNYVKTKPQYDGFIITGYKHTYYANSAVVGTKTTTNSEPSNLTVGDFTYKPEIAAGGTIVSNLTYWGVKIVETNNKVLDKVTVQTGGLGYTFLDVVTNSFGDTCSIQGVSNTTGSADEVGGNYWKSRTVGDSETNPMPSFVGGNIHGISFFRNRLVFTSGENVICSQAGDYFDFFLSTAITVVDSDSIDLSCGSLRPVELRYAIPSAKGLLLFSSVAQYILTTSTDAFSAASAEINSISEYEQDEAIPPFDTGSSIIFIKEGDKATNVFEMAIAERTEVVEITRTVPSYLPAAIRDLNGSSSASTFAFLSKQEPNNLYLFRYFNAESRLMSSWFKWTFDSEVETFQFDHDLIYIVLKQENGYVLGRMNLLTETPGGALIFDDQYVDLRLDLFDYNPTIVYNAGTDRTRICFKDGFESTTAQPVLVTLDADDPGLALELPLETDLTQPTGQKYFVSIPNDQSTSKFAIGYKYVASAELPAFYVTQEEGRKDTLNIPMVYRMTINSYESGPYKVQVEAENRPLFEQTLPQEVANAYPANTVPMVRNARSTVPVMAKGNQVNVTLVADSVFPTSFTSINWEGTYNNRGIRLS